MKLSSAHFSSILIAICTSFGTICCNMQQPAQPQIVARLSDFKANLEVTKTRKDYDSLHFFLAENYAELTTADRRTMRETLEKHAIWSSMSTCPATESGTQLTLRGQLTDETGNPLRGERLHVFHTDNHGYYAPTDSITGGMAENDPRLEGFLVTDSAGRFEIRGIRPASYPKKYMGRTIPQHVHIVAAVAGFRPENFQVVFADDPAMSEHWETWAKKLRNPIVKLTLTDTGYFGEFKLVLLKN